MRVEVLLNSGSGGNGTGASTREMVSAALAAEGIEATVREVAGEGLHDEAKGALSRGVDAVIAGGGDGTISAVAAALAGGDVPLGILPLGTLNHFAKDNGIPLDLPGAARVIAAGHVARLDVGRVGERVFINNSSVGVYARALVDRDVRRDHWGMSKWPAMLLASFKIFRRSPLLRVRLATDEERMLRKTPLVFLGNNQYELNLFRVGTRRRLDEGVLSLYVATATTRWGMFKLGVRAALGRLKQSRDFETRCVESVQIATRRSTIHVAIDGEITRMATPLEYRIWPKALPVIVPVRPQLANGEASGAERFNGDAAKSLT